MAHHGLELIAVHAPCDQQVRSRGRSVDRFLLQRDHLGRERSSLPHPGGVNGFGPCIPALLVNLADCRAVPLLTERATFSPLQPVRRSQRRRLDERRDRISGSLPAWITQPALKATASVKAAGPRVRKVAVKGVRVAIRRARVRSSRDGSHPTSVIVGLSARRTWFPPSCEAGYKRVPDAWAENVLQSGRPLSFGFSPSLAHSIQLIGRRELDPALLPP